MKKLLSIVILLLITTLIAGCSTDDPIYTSTVITANEASDNTTGTVTLVDENGNPLNVDDVTGNFVVITQEHLEIHEGDHYFIEGFATLGVGGTLHVKLVTPDTARFGHFVWELHSSGILTAVLHEDATGGMAGGSRPTIHANNRNIGCWTGRQTGANDAALLTDSSKSWIPDVLIGKQIYNTSDGSSGIITDNDVTTVTATLSGGTENDWDTTDAYEINGSLFVITSDVAACTDRIQIVGNESFGSKSADGTVSRDDELVLKRNTVYCRSFTSSTAGNIVGFKASWYELGEE